MSLNKTVTSSSSWHQIESHHINYEYDHYLVDGLKNVNAVFSTAYDDYPWATIDLHRLSIIKNVIVYNRADGHGMFGIWIGRSLVSIATCSFWQLRIGQLRNCDDIANKGLQNLFLSLLSMRERNLYRARSVVTWDLVFADDIVVNAYYGLQKLGLFMAPSAFDHDGIFIVSNLL